MRNERPYNLYCSIDADGPGELARVLREIASDINLPGETELQIEGDVLVEVSGDRHSNWYLRVRHTTTPPRQSSAA